jgi:hypothetical protein
MDAFGGKRGDDRKLKGIYSRCTMAKIKYTIEPHFGLKKKEGNLCQVPRWNSQ